MNRYWAEFFGTFALVFAGAGAIVVNQVTDGAVSHPGIALTFGLVVMAIIYAIGDVSGAHINPAVTIAFAVAKRFPAIQVLPYIASQMLGALTAAVLLRCLFPANENLGATLPFNSALQSLVLEIILTWFLMWVILGVSTGSKETGMMAGVAIGGVVGLEAMFAGPICGASMNPARSLGPALVSGTFTHQWIYLVGPIVGALLAILTFWLVHHSGDKEIVQKEIV